MVYYDRHMRKIFMKKMLAACCLLACAFAHSAPLRVMTYNIRYSAGDRVSPDNNWDARKGGLADLIAGESPDVVGFQEVLPEQMEFLKTRFPSYTFVGEFRNADRRSGEASPIAFKSDRFRAVKCGTFWLSETPDAAGSISWGAKYPRVCSYAVLDDAAGGRRFAFANTHTDHKSEEAREKGMLLVIERMKEFAGNVPIVFTGDHNCLEFDKCAMPVKEKLKDTLYLSETPPEGPWRTCNHWAWREQEVSTSDALKLPPEKRSAKGDDTERIDYIYATPGTKVLSYRTIAAPRSGLKRYPSDHFPIVADIVPSMPGLMPFGKFADGLLSNTRPCGWLGRVCRLQADGLTGHPEALSYPYDTCLWAGEIPRMGTHGSDWWRYEQTAYYTDGLLRLGYALGDAELIKKGETGVEYTLAHVAPDGHLGSPCLWDASKFKLKRGYDMWPFAVFFRAMKAKYDAAPDERIPAALARYFLLYGKKHVSEYRNVVNVEGLLWAYSHTGDRRLLDLAESAWRMRKPLPDNKKNELAPENCANDRPIHMHGVSYCEEMKVPVILAAYTGKNEYLDQAVNVERKLVRDHMLPDGCNSSTERVRGNSVHWGHETCDVADYTWTLGYFLETTGDATYADKIERCVFNAGFGAIGKDFRSLQYFSNPNQFICTSNSDNNPHAYGTTWMQYRPTHETECCAGNVHRIVPNYVSRMWLRDAKGHPVAALYGPSEVDFGWAKITEETDYPFDGRITFRFSVKQSGERSFTYRVPSWCRKGASVKVNGESVAPAAPGRFATIYRPFADGDVVELHFPMEPVFETLPSRFVVDNKDMKRGLKRPADRFADSSQGTVVTMGPLVFAHPIKAERAEDTEEHANMNGKKSANPDFKCWNLRPAAPFNYALVAHRAEVVASGCAGDGFFMHPAAVKLRVPVRRIEWTLDEDRFTPDVPEHPVVLDGEEEAIELVPYGATMLRLSVFPDLSSGKTAHSAELYMAGDSIMAEYKPSEWPQYGWGQALKSFMKEPERLHNFARSGWSARRFRESGRWEKCIASKLKPGDWAIVSFGHNDSNRRRNKLPKNDYSTIDEYKAFLKGFADDARAKGANIAFATSIPSSAGFSPSNGVMCVGGDNLTMRFSAYVKAMRELAAELNVPLLDLNRYAAENLPKLGMDEAKALYMTIKPGEYANYPDGKNDPAHVRDAGAYFYAKGAVEMARAQGLSLADLLKAPESVPFVPVAAPSRFAASVWRGETAYVEIPEAFQDKMSILAERWSALEDVSLTLLRFDEVKYDHTEKYKDEEGKTKTRITGKGSVPDVCREWKNGDAAKPTMIKVAVSPDAKPTTHVFELARSGNGSDLFMLKVVDRVLPPAKEWKYFLDLWQHPWAVARYFGVEPFSPEHYAKMEPVWRALADCGCKALTVTLLDLPWNNQCYDAYHSMVGRVRTADGKWKFDYSLFDEYVAFGRKCGLGPDIACYTMCPWGYRATWKDEDGKDYRVKMLPGTPEFEDYWGGFLVDFAAHLKAKGWFADAYIAMDERKPEDVRKVIDLIQKYAPGMKVAMAGNKSPAEFSGMKIDNYCQGLIHLRKHPKMLDELEPRRRNGCKTTFYVCCTAAHPNTFVDSPYDEGYWLGAYPGVSGFDGFLRWAANSWPENPYLDASFKSESWRPGDTFFVYPGGELSPRMIALRAGVVAAEKLRILRESGVDVSKECAELAAKYGYRDACANKIDFSAFRRAVEAFVNSER